MLIYLFLKAIIPTISAIFSLGGECLVYMLKNVSVMLVFIEKCCTFAHLLADEVSLRYLNNFM